MVCGYFLSRFDERAYAALRYHTQHATHEALGALLDVAPESIKNWRDEFDPVHDTPRQGWHKRPMAPSRRRTIEALGGLDEDSILSLVKAILWSPNGPTANEVVDAIGNAEGEDDAQQHGIRGPTGVAAELAFKAYHAATALPARGALRDRRHDECGYDFEIDSDTGPIAVEVKGIAGQAGGVSFTNAEWRKAGELGDSYYLAVVRNVAEKPTVSLIRNPRSAFAAEMRAYTIVQVSWTVSQSDLGSAEDETTG